MFRGGQHGFFGGLRSNSAMRPKVIDQAAIPRFDRRGEEFGGVSETNVEKSAWCPADTTVLNRFRQFPLMQHRLSTDLDDGHVLRRQHTQNGGGLARERKLFRPRPRISPMFSDWRANPEPLPQPNARNATNYTADGNASCLYSSNISHSIGVTLLPSMPAQLLS